MYLLILSGKELSFKLKGRVYTSVKSCLVHGTTTIPEKLLSAEIYEDWSQSVW